MELKTECGVTDSLSALGGQFGFMSYFVYVLKNENDQIYIGQTNNLVDRLMRHNSGTQKFTRGKGPFRIAYQEEYQTRTEAMCREKALKSGQGREWIRKNVV